MVQKILCKKCEEDCRNLFPIESPYPGEYIKFVPGIAKKSMLCDDCGLDLLIGDNVCAFSIFTDERPYGAWEEEYINIKE